MRNAHDETRKMRRGAVDVETGERREDTRRKPVANMRARGGDHDAMTGVVALEDRTTMRTSGRRRRESKGDLILDFDFDADPSASSPASRKRKTDEDSEDRPRRKLSSRSKGAIKEED